MSRLLSSQISLTPPIFRHLVLARVDPSAPKNFQHITTPLRRLGRTPQSHILKYTIEPKNPLPPAFLDPGLSCWL